jgi:hypothetical protein
MNLIGKPFEGYFWQVKVMVVVRGLFALYVFVKLGWLKT